MVNYNELLANLQANANSKAEIINEKEALKKLKSEITENDCDEHFNTIYQAFYAVEEEIKAGISQEKTILKVEQGFQGALDFRYFTGHKFSLHHSTNSIEDNPIFATIKIELPYSLKSKSSMMDGIIIKDKVINLKYDFQNNKFVWVDEDLQTEVKEEDLKHFIVQVLNIRLLNTQDAF